MASLQELIGYDPATGGFGNLCEVRNFVLNLAYYLIFSALIIFTVYNIVKAIYVVTKSDSSETMEKFSESITNIVYSVVGLLLIGSIWFIPSVIFNTMGLDEEYNPFRAGACIL